MRRTAANRGTSRGLLRLAVASGLVRAWTRLYTWRMEPAVRDARRSEIESDLWEFEHELPLAAAQVVIRLLCGVPDDLCWRVEHVAFEESPLSSRGVLTAVTALLVAALWTAGVVLAGPPSGRAAVLDCAGKSAPPQTREEYRLRVVTCAGAFFTPRQ